MEGVEEVGGELLVEEVHWEEEDGRGQVGWGEL